MQTITTMIEVLGATGKTGRYEPGTIMAPEGALEWLILAASRHPVA